MVVAARRWWSRQWTPRLAASVFFVATRQATTRPAGAAGCRVTAPTKGQRRESETIATRGPRHARVQPVCGHGLDAYADCRRPTAFGARCLLFRNDVRVAVRSVAANLRARFGLRRPLLAARSRDLRAR